MTRGLTHETVNILMIPYHTVIPGDRTTLVGYDLSKSQRSLCAQFRSGILPLHVETGRYTGTELDQRLCGYCELGEVEDETHFLLYCPFYHDLRKTLFDKVHVGLSHDSDLIKYLFDNHSFAIANFIHKAWNRRKRVTYA